MGKYGCVSGRWFRLQIGSFSIPYDQAILYMHQWEEVEGTRWLYFGWLFLWGLFLPSTNAREKGTFLFLVRLCFISDKHISRFFLSREPIAHKRPCYASLQEVMHFFGQLTAGMGQNVKFILEHVCEDDEFTAGVNWHLGIILSHCLALRCICS